MRWWVWLLLGLSQAFLIAGASFLLPRQLLKRSQYSWGAFGGPRGRYASREATPSFKQAIICDINNRRDNRHDRRGIGIAVSERPSCISFVSLRKLDSLTDIAATQHFLKGYHHGHNSQAASSDVTKRCPSLPASHASKNPLFSNPTRRYSSADDVGRSSQEVPSQCAPTDSLLPPRGFRDFPPDVLAIHKHIFSCWHEVASEFGFMEYKGPSVERYSLYSPFCRSLPPSAPSPRTAISSDSGFASPAVSIPPHIYLLQVDGPEPICLRPELTPSLSRMLQREQHQHPSGIARRWYSVERVWRHEKPGCGRRREHFQWNLDIALPSLPTRNTFTAPDTADAAQQTQGRQNNQKRQNMGSPATGFSSFAAAELIAAAVRLFQKLGLSSRDVRIRVGSRSLLRDLLWTEEELRSPETSVPLSATAKEDRTPDNGTLLSGTTPHFFSTHDECIFRQRLTTAMQILDRASRQSREETEIALANGLGITVEKSRRILQRLISFDVNNESMVRELGRKLQRLGKGDGMQQGDGSKLDHTGSERPSDGTGVLSSWLPTSVNDLQCVLHLLREGYGIGDWVDVDLLIVRGLHYYTGVVFEAFDSEGVFRAILGGGCYGEPGASVAVMETTAEGPSVSTESPEVPTMHLKPHKSGNRRNVRSGVSGVGLGMGDCVLIELLQRKGLLPIPGSTVDIIVAPRQNSAAQDPPGEVPGVSPSCASNGNQRLPVMDESRDKLRYSTPSATSVSNWHSVAAEQLCCKLRALGLRVELLLPPHRSERAAIKHARSVGAKAVVFVAPRVQELPVFEVDASIPDSAAEVPPSLFSGAKEMRNPTEFKVFLIPEENQNSTPLSKQQQTSQPGDLHPIRCTSGSLRHAGTLTTIPSVVEMLEANLRLSSQDRQP